MRTDSAKPAPSLKRIIAHLKERSILFDEDEEGHQYIEVGIEDAEQILKALEAQPAAERTALKELRKKVEHGPWITLYDCQDCGQLLTSTLYQIHNADHTVITLNYIDRMAMLAEIDAQERAGAKAASEETA